MSPSIGMSIGMDVRANLSPFHIHAAALFARDSWRLESEHGDKPLEELRGTGLVEDDEGYVIGAVFTSVAFLEAKINELFDDMVGATETTSFKQLAPDNREKMARWWELEQGNQARTLEKFQGALTAIGKCPFDTKVSPYQDADNLIELRNELVHYRPKLIPVGATVPDGITRRLEGKFSTNPWYRGRGNPFYPHKCLGHGCAEWAVKSSLRFTDKVFERMGITTKYDSLRTRLETK